MAKMLLYFRTNSIDLFNSIDISSSDIYILALTQQLHKFISIMESMQLNIEVNVILWTLFANNSFSVKTCYVLINDGRIRLQFSKHIWKCSAPLKIKIFALLVTHDKILSKENLARKE